MKLQPIGRSLLVQIKPPEKKGTLFLSVQSDEPIQAKVLCVGEKVEAPIRENDLVLLSPYAGSKIKGGSESEPFMLVGEKEILGILRDE